MTLLKYLAMAAFAIICLLGAGLAWFALDRWPPDPPSPYGRLPRSWRPDPMTTEKP